jgi:LuxR family maltose regulon positive regulatory protein
MTIPLLTTKLYIPPVRPEWVSRPRLIERLNAGIHRKLVLISAPAGFGKTTLLSAWIHSGVSSREYGVGKEYEPAGEVSLTPYSALPTPRFAWLSLDEGDNDLTRFLTYFVAALQMIPSLSEAGVGESTLAMLHAAQPQPPSVEAILTALINEMASIPTPFILVLDDYHLIQTQLIHDALTFLLDHLPPPMHLALATRADPPLPIARLRGQGQLIELRQADLRFTPEEAAEFLNQVMGLSLSADDVAALESRTEGWIVGLQLAALSLQGRADTHDFITAFSGGHHYVLEYLSEEVVRRQPEPVQRFLMQTSILERLCGPLCNAVTGESDSEAILAHLRQRNLFILPLDDEYRWHRYHHLFADLLGSLLRKAWPPEHIQALHLRACEWYDRNGLTPEAVSHALAARDFDRTAQLIERNSLAMVTRGELTTLLRWIDALPDNLAHSRPWLCVHQAWPLTFAGKAEAVEPLLQQIEQQVSSDNLTPEHEEILGNVAAMRAMLATMHGDMPQAIELAHRADELLPPDSLNARSIIPYALASAYYAEGDLVKADQALAGKLKMGRASDNLWTVVRALCDLADLRMIQGQLRRATDLCQEALQWAEARGARQFGTVGYVLVKIGELLHARNDLIAARDHVLEGVNLMQGWQQPYEMVSGYTALAAILQAQSDAEGAIEALQNAEKIRSRHPNYHKLNHLVHGCRIRLCLAQGGPEDAARQAMETGLSETGALIFREQEQIILARVLIAQGRWNEALPLLVQLAEDAETGGRFGRLIEILALQAVARQVQGDTTHALIALEKALTMGEPEGYVRVFVEQGAPMAALLRQAAARGIAPDYVSGPLAAFGAEEKESALASLPPSTPSIAESLTSREIEVLQLIGEGHSNQEIAKALVITLNTVKKHTSGIYGKLGVHSRTQALARAQELGLL